MKGPNPFAHWEESPDSIFGRKEETRIFSTFINATISKQPGLLVITGVPGYGKSSLLRFFRSLAEKEGVLAPLVKAEKGENENVVVDKLFHEMAILPGFKGKGAADFRELVGTSRTDERHYGIMLFIDDIDMMKKSDDIISSISDIMKDIWGKEAFSVVVSSTREFRVEPEVVSTMVLAPFSEDQARKMVEKALKDKKLKMGEECLKSIMGDTGGNQKLFKSVCRYIYDRLRDDEKVMTKGHYLAYLPYIMSMLSRESFGRMYQETPAAERAILHALAAADDGMHVSDIAKGLEKPLGPVTALVRRLLDRGQIMKIERGKYRIFSKMYARYVLQRG
jgi:hypothetical protein